MKPAQTFRSAMAERFEYAGLILTMGFPWRPRRGLIDLDDGPYDGPGDRLYD